MLWSTPIGFIFIVYLRAWKFSMATSRLCLRTVRVYSFVYANGNVNSDQSDLFSQRAGRANDAPHPAFKRDCNLKSLRYKFPIIKWMPRFIRESIAQRIARIRTCTAIFIHRIQSSVSVKYLRSLSLSLSLQEISCRMHIEHSLIYLYGYR